MSLSFDKLPGPMNADAQGVVRVGGTRVTLDTVVGAFQRGATAEEIVQDYSSLRLADVYTAIAFYLQNRSGVDAYLEEQRHKGDEIQRRIEAGSDPAEFRQRLLAREALPIGRVIDDMVIIIECSEQAEWGAGAISASVSRS